MKRMLFNATHAEETRVGIVDGSQLIDIDIETVGQEARKSNIYKGVITRIEPSLEACFVDYGEGRHGFLPFKEISRSYYAPGCDRSSTIREAVSEGQEVLVQIIKDERGTKGAGLTTYISLAGRYLVLMPNNPRGGGVSRRIEGPERDELREAMRRLDVPHGMSTIARTAGIGRTTEELQWDLNYLLKLWEAITEAARPQFELPGEGKSSAIVSTPTVNGRALKRINPPPFLIVEESNLVVRAIRDYFQPDIEEILVDTVDIYQQARQFMSHVMPDMVSRVKLYQEEIPLFTRFQIEQQIETAYSRTVPLPSGGAIVIDHTEALVAIDVNSARSTRGSDIEETALRTNLEAADEVARQMRLRDLGGLIVIDFIDMDDPTNQKAVETRIRNAIRFDRARVQTARISRFGLMEVSRQRLRPSLSEGSHVTCPRCNGVGVIRDTESCAIQVLRILQEEAIKDDTGAVEAQVPVDVATFLLNEKRNDIAGLEVRHQVPVILVPNTSLVTPHYHIERILEGDDRLEKMAPSFKLAEEIETVVDDPYAQKSRDAAPARPRQVPVIKNVLPSEPAPVHAEKEEAAKTEEKVEAVQPAKPAEKGFFTRLIEAIFGTSEKKEKTEEKPLSKDESEEEKTEDRKRRRVDRSERSKRRRGKGERLERSEDDKPTSRRERAAKGESKAEVVRADKTDGESPRRSRRSRRDEKNAEKPQEAVVQAEIVEKKNALIPAPRTDLIVVESEENQDEKKRRRRRRSKAERAEEVQAAEVQAQAEQSVDQLPDADDLQEPHGEEVKPGTVTFIEDIIVEEVTEAAPASEEKEEVRSDEEAPKRRPRRRRRKDRDSQAEKQEVQTESSESAEEKAVEVEAAAAAPAEEAAAETVPQVQPEVQAPSADQEAPAEAAQEAPEDKARLEALQDLDALEEAARDSRERFSRRKSTDIYRRDKRRGRRSDKAEKQRAEEAAPHAAAEEAVEQAAAPEVEMVQAPRTEAVDEAAAVEVREEAAVQAPAEEAPDAEAQPQAASEAQEAAAEQAEEVQQEAAVQEPDQVVVLEVAAGLAENLKAAGLVQVETLPGAAQFTGYAAVVHAGRPAAAGALQEEEGELIQVETKPELCEPYSYHAPKFPGRTAVKVEAADEGPLVQVETRKD